MHIVTQDEAIARLPQLIDEATKTGEEVLVLRNQTAVARIVPVGTLQEPKPRPRFGSARGQILMHEDFDAPLDDFKEYE